MTAGNDRTTRAYQLGKLRGARELLILRQGKPGHVSSLQELMRDQARKAATHRLAAAEATYNWLTQFPTDEIQESIRAMQQFVALHDDLTTAQQRLTKPAE